MEDRILDFFNWQYDETGWPYIPHITVFEVFPKPEVKALIKQGLLSYHETVKGYTIYRPEHEDELFANEKIRNHARNTI